MAHLALCGKSVERVSLSMTHSAKAKLGFAIMGERNVDGKRSVGDTVEMEVSRSHSVLRNRSSRVIVCAITQ